MNVKRLGAPRRTAFENERRLLLPVRLREAFFSLLFFFRNDRTASLDDPRVANQILQQLHSRGPLVQTRGVF